MIAHEKELSKFGGFFTFLFIVWLRVVSNYDGNNHIQQRYTGDDAGIIGRIRGSKRSS